MAIAEGNKRVSATLDPVRQGRLNFLLGLDPKNKKRITTFFCECIDKEFHQRATSVNSTKGVMNYRGKEFDT